VSPRLSRLQRKPIADEYGRGPLRHADRDRDDYPGRDAVNVYARSRSGELWHAVHDPDSDRDSNPHGDEYRDQHSWAEATATDHGPTDSGHCYGVAAAIMDRRHCWVVA
jgi:hypothetical protein